MSFYFGQVFSGTPGILLFIHCVLLTDRTWTVFVIKSWTNWILCPWISTLLSNSNYLATPGFEPTHAFVTFLFRDDVTWMANKSIAKCPCEERPWPTEDPDLAKKNTGVCGITWTSMSFLSVRGFFKGCTNTLSTVLY